MGAPLSARRDLLDRHILSKLTEPIRESPELRAGLKDLIASVRAQGFEGLVAKRRDSRYEPGQGSGAWQKMRIKKGQEFVIAGYTLGGATFDALVFGYYEGSKLLHVSRTRNGFTPRLRKISGHGEICEWALSSGRIARSATARLDFRSYNPAQQPARPKGPCAGYVIDHIQAVKHGGADSSNNTQ